MGPAARQTSALGTGLLRINTNMRKFADRQRALLGVDGVEIERRYVTVEGEDVGQNAPSWLRESVLSVVASRVKNGGKGGTTFDEPQIYPRGQLLTDDTGLFRLASESGSSTSTREMTKLVPAPVDGQPDRVVFGWGENDPNDDLQDGSWVVSMDVARAAITAVLPLGCSGNVCGLPRDVVVGNDGDVYMVETRSSSDDSAPNDVVVHSVSGDLSAVKWKQKFTATASTAGGYGTGFQASDMTVGDENLVVVAELRAASPDGSEKETKAPAFSITGGGADESLQLEMLAGMVPPPSQNPSVPDGPRMLRCYFWIRKPEPL